eukprot:1841695-Prymnesium_polylepis.1
MASPRVCHVPTGTLYLYCESVCVQSPCPRHGSHVMRPECIATLSDAGAPRGSHESHAGL